MKVLFNLKSRRRHKSLFIMLLMLSAISLFAADEGNIFSIPITFTANTGVNVGFSDKRIDTVLKQDSSLSRIEFDIDPIDNVIRTGTFYFYVQIYTTDRIKVSTAAVAPLSGNSNNESLAWTNEGESLGSIKGSSSAGVVVIEESDDVDTAKPRIYNVGMNFAIPISSLTGKSSTEYEANLSFKVETI